MPKQTKILTEEDKYKQALAAESELLHQRRHYHLLERGRNARCVNLTLAKQRRVINILKSEYNEILTDLSIADSIENNKHDDKVANNLQDLMKAYKQFDADIQMENAYLNELDTQINLAKKDILNLRKEIPDEHKRTQRNHHDQKVLDSLENKLECATKRFCLTLSDNRNLRNEINHLLLERAHFNKIWNKLLTNLSSARGYMIDLIEQATMTYDQREDWVTKLNKLRTKAYTDFISHSLDMTEMQRRIDNETKLEKFFIIKGQKRIMRDLLMKEQHKRDQQRKEMEELIQHYTESLDEIKEFMTETNLTKIVAKFCITEQDNFNKFQYVTQMTSEVEELSSELMQLRIVIDEQQYLQEERLANQNNKIANLEREYTDWSSEADEAELELKNGEKMLKDVLDGIQMIFNQCRCSTAPIMELLGNQTSINIYNAPLYIQIMEKRLNDVMINTYYKDRKKASTQHAQFKSVIQDNKIRYHSVTVDELVSKDPCPLCVEKAMVSDVIDSLQSILGKEEILSYLIGAIEEHNFLDVIHNVSGCQLPKSRAILQARFQ